MVVIENMTLTPTNLTIAVDDDFIEFVKLRISRHRCYEVNSEVIVTALGRPIAFMVTAITPEQGMFTDETSLFIESSPVRVKGFFVVEDIMGDYRLKREKKSFEEILYDAVNRKATISDAIKCKVFDLSDTFKRASDQLTELARLMMRYDTSEPTIPKEKEQ